jgi:hypothetical protein
MQNEQQTSKLDSVRQEQLAKRSIGFGSLTGSKEGLMKAREGTDMKVRAIIKDSSGSKSKNSKGKQGTEQLWQLPQEFQVDQEELLDTTLVNHGTRGRGRK